jgi:SRSO17 transposase
VCDVAMVRVTEAREGLPGPRLWLIIRRNVADPTDVRYYLSNASDTTAEAELARMLGMRWPVELTFEQGKQEVGLDDYEVRSWQGAPSHGDGDAGAPFPGLGTAGMERERWR